MKKGRILKDPAGLWERASLPYRLEWLMHSKVDQRRLVALLRLGWEELPFSVQVAIGTMR